MLTAEISVQIGSAVPYDNVLRILLQHNHVLNVITKLSKRYVKKI